METPEARLAAHGLVLPQPAAPVAAYVPAVREGEFLFISGQLCFRDGVLITGRLGETLDIPEGIAAAEACGLMILAQARAALDGSLARVRRCVRLGGFVASAPTFTDQPRIVNGASELMLRAFGEAGRHARAAVGVPVLPLGAAVEVEALFAIS